MGLITSKVKQSRFKGHLPELYTLSKDPWYALKFPPILQCFICGLLLKDDSAVVEEVTRDNSELVSRGKEIMHQKNESEELLVDNLKHLDAELKSNGAFLTGKELSVADITIFCRLCFIDGLGILQEQKLEALTSWFKQLKESRPHFLDISKQISDLF